MGRWGEKIREAFFKKYVREARKARQEADEGDHSSDKDKAWIVGSREIKATDWDETDIMEI